MSASNEGLNEIMVRTGAHQMVLGQELGLLSGNDKNSMVNVTLADEEGNVLHFADQKYAKFGTTTIDDSAFDNCGSAILICPGNSEACRFAIRNGMHYINR